MGKVRIAFFELGYLEDYPEIEVEMTEEEIDEFEARCYYDENCDMWYTSDESIGYQILEW